MFKFAFAHYEYWYEHRLGRIKSVSIRRAENADIDH